MDNTVTLKGKCNCCSPYPEDRYLNIQEHHDGILIELDGKEIVLSQDQFIKMVQLSTILFN